MHTPRHVHRPALACMLAFAVVAMSGTAVARPIDRPDGREAARTPSLAGTTSTPSQDLRSPDARDAARLDELAVPRSPASSDDARWVAIALAIAAALAVLALTATQLRRLRIRRRRALSATS